MSFDRIIEITFVITKQEVLALILGQQMNWVSVISDIQGMEQWSRLGVSDICGHLSLDYWNLTLLSVWGPFANVGHQLRCFACKVLSQTVKLSAYPIVFEKPLDVYSQSICQSVVCIWNEMYTLHFCLNTKLQPFVEGSNFISFEILATKYARPLLLFQNYCTRFEGLVIWRVAKLNKFLSNFCGLTTIWKQWPLSMHCCENLMHLHAHHWKHK
jgi:hypothetical protein